MASLRDARCVLIDDPVVSLRSTTGYRLRSRWDQYTNDVRQTLIDRGIHPEPLLPDEDVKKVERRLISEEKKFLKKPESLGGLIRNENEPPKPPAPVSPLAEHMNAIGLAPFSN